MTDKIEHIADSPAVSLAEAQVMLMREYQRGLKQGLPESVQAAIFHWQGNLAYGQVVQGGIPELPGIVRVTYDAFVRGSELTSDVAELIRQKAPDLYYNVQAQGFSSGQLLHREGNLLTTLTSAEKALLDCKRQRL